MIMPGRYSITKEKGDIELRFLSKFSSDDFKKRYNISPTQKVPIILNTNPKKIVFAKWGYLTDWYKRPLINARSENITKNRVFSKSFSDRRCLIIADSYYEWEKIGNEKIPWRVMLKDESLFAMAGVWEEKDGDIYFAVITVSPNELIGEIHDRMPVILEKESEKNWLEKPDETLLKTFNKSEMKLIKVSNAINSSKNDNVDLLKPVEKQKKLF